MTLGIAMRLGSFARIGTPVAAIALVTLRALLTPFTLRTVLTWGVCGVTAAIALAAPFARAADLPHVQVRGVERIDVHAARSRGKLVLSGVVTDEQAVAVAGATIDFKLMGGSAASIESCGSTGDRIAAGLLGPIELPTDAQARFCVRLSLPAGSYVARFEARPSPFLDGIGLDLQLDPTRKPVTLRFDPEPSILDIDGDSFSVDVMATTEDEGEISAVPGILLRLSNETDVSLASATTSSSGAAHFQVASGASGDAGRGELRASFDGSAESAPSTHAALVERRTRVHLEGPSAADPVARAIVTKDRVFSEVSAVPACVVHGCSASPTGSVEMYFADKLVAASPLTNGRARLATTLSTDSTGVPGDAPFRLRYIPNAPWFVPAYDVSLPRRGPPTSAWGEVFAALAGLAAAGWVVASRWPRRAVAIEVPMPGAPALARAGITIVRASTAQPGLAGRVVDAHEGDAIAAAQVRLERAGFQGTDVISRASSDAHGRFELAVGEARAGDELVVESGLYRTMRSPIAIRGEIQIALVLRRRKLVDDLVHWARRRGGRFDARPEPTPGHVVRSAGSETSVATWAAALEHAVYGSEVLDEEAEARVNRLAPATPDPPPLGGAPRNRARPPRGA
jgi:hypothetical protein